MDDTVTYGLSIDVGTTWVTVHVVDILKNQVVLEKVFENPQSVVGFDVVTRIKYSLASQRNSDWLTSIIRSSVNRGIQETLRTANIPPECVETIVLVGNTVMHHLFYGLPVDSLLQSPYTADRTNRIITKAGKIGLKTGEDTVCYSPPVIESFMGPDAVAVILASDLLSRSDPSLALDVGTNTEILVRAGKELLAASAASGPAFEGMSIDCGTSAKDGAILSVKINRKNLEPRIEVIGNEKPVGICGSGIVSALAEMLRAGVMDSVGSINRGLQSVWLPRNAEITRYLLCQATETANGQPLYVSQPDVRMIQQSKGAINAAIEMVLQSCDLSPAEMQAVYLTGSFGSRLNLEDAYRIGLFPRFAHAQVNQVHGGASIGADIMVIDPSARRKAEKAARSVRYLELVDNPEFEARYAQSQLFPTQDQ